MIDAVHKQKRDDKEEVEQGEYEIKGRCGEIWKAWEIEAREIVAREGGGYGA